MPEWFVKATEKAEAEHMKDIGLLVAEANAHTSTAPFGGEGEGTTAVNFQQEVAKLHSSLSSRCYERKT